jgi:hypothetical protein
VHELCQGQSMGSFHGAARRLQSLCTGVFRGPSAGSAALAHAHLKPAACMRLLAAVLRLHGPLEPQGLRACEDQRQNRPLTLRQMHALLRASWRRRR